VRPRPGFLHLAVDYSLALPLGASIALLWSNTFHQSYELYTRALRFPINDVAMVFFFAVATKEVVDATAHGGALHTWRRAALPVIAAAGGMAVPALVYALIATATDPALLRGWAIPCATDIAFSYLVARLIFRRHPAIPFLLLLAIADDAIGLVVLAVFYPLGDLHLLTGALLMAAALLTAFGLRRARVASFWPYIAAAGPLSWAALHLGGLHPALALVPIVPFFSGADALERFELRWKHPVQIILFLFALANAGVVVQRYGVGTWAVLAGLVAGKPVGIGLAIALAVAAGFRLPDRFRWQDVVVIGCACGIGFTVSLFFATAAFEPGRLLDETKIGALLSVGAALVAIAAAKMLGVGRFGRSA